MKAGPVMAAVVFVLTAIDHALSLASSVDVTVGTTELPVWVSTMSIVVSVGLDGLLFRQGGVVCKREGVSGVKELRAPQ